MNPFLSIDISVDKKNKENNSAELLAGSASPALREALDKASGEMNKEVMKYLGKTVGTALAKYLCLTVSIVLTLYGVLRYLVELKFDFGAAYAEVPELFWLVGGVWVATVLVWILLHKKEPTEDEDGPDIADPIASDIESITAAINAELGVPSNAALVDVITYTYKWKDGEAVPKATDSHFPPYTIELLSIFRQGDTLCFTTDADKYAFPLAGLKAIRTVDKPLTVFSFWTKDIQPSEGIYKEYDIKEKDATLVFKPYHILEAEVHGTLWGILFPCYELPIFEQLTGLKAE